MHKDYHEFPNGTRNGLIYSVIFFYVGGATVSVTATSHLHTYWCMPTKDPAF